MSSITDQNLLVEPARSSDLPAIRRLLRANDLPDTDLSTTHLRLFRVTRSGEQLAGVIGLERVDHKLGLLRSLVVDPRCRGLGLGDTLLEHGQRLARQNGVSTLYLLTTTAGDWFASKGYSTQRRDAVPPALQATSEFRQLCPASALCMKKDL